MGIFFYLPFFIVLLFVGHFSGKNELDSTRESTCLVIKSWIKAGGVYCIKLFNVIQNICSTVLALLSVFLHRIASYYRGELHCWL